MDSRRFDDLTRALAHLEPRTSRRSVLRGLVAGLLSTGIALSIDLYSGAAARERTERPPRPERRRRCRHTQKCRAGEICRDGYCFSCWPTKIPCGDTCVDPLTDPTNCGDCGIVCADGEVCGEGFCGLPCSNNFDCPDNLDFHCELGVCFGGGCSIVALDCQADQPNQDCCKTADDLFCVDFATNPNHCGRCYNACDDGCCSGECC